MTADQDAKLSPAHTLTLVRSAYYMNIACCVILILLGWFALWYFEMTPRPTLGWVGLGFGMALFILLTGIGLFIRQQSYKRHWVENRVTPPGYLFGNLLYHTIHEVTVIVAVGFMFFAGSLWPAVLPALLATIVMAMAYPNGRVMQPTARTQP